MKILSQFLILSAEGGCLPPSLLSSLYAMLSGGGVGQRGCESLEKEQGGGSSLGRKARPRDMKLLLGSPAAPVGHGLAQGEPQLGGYCRGSRRRWWGPPCGEEGVAQNWKGGHEGGKLKGNRRLQGAGSSSQVQARAEGLNFWVLGWMGRTSGSSRKPHLDSAWPVASGNQDPWAQRQGLPTHSSTWARHLRLDRWGRATWEARPCG